MLRAVVLVLFFVEEVTAFSGLIVLSEVVFTLS